MTTTPVIELFGTQLRALLDGGAPEAAPASGAGLDVALRGVRRVRASRAILRDIDLHIASGECIAIVGRSGSGKSALMRVLAGLERPDEGHAWSGGTTLSAWRDDIRLVDGPIPARRWRRVIDAVRSGPITPPATECALDALTRVGLADRARAATARLSRGERTRLALARTLVQRPRLLLLDEPLCALDDETRAKMRGLIAALRHASGCTVVLATTDLRDAVALADRVLLIDDGRIALERRLDRAPQVAGTPPPRSLAKQFEALPSAASRRR